MDLSQLTVFVWKQFQQEEVGWVYVSGGGGGG